MEVYAFSVIAMILPASYIYMPSCVVYVGILSQLNGMAIVGGTFYPHICTMAVCFYRNNVTLLEACVYTQLMRCDLL